MGSQYSPLNSPRAPWTPRSKATSACWLAIISLALSTFALFSTIHASTLLQRGSGTADGGIRKAILRSILLTADDVDVSTKNIPLLMAEDDAHDSNIAIVLRKNDVKGDLADKRVRRDKVIDKESERGVIDAVISQPDPPLKRSSSSSSTSSKDGSDVQIFNNKTDTEADRKRPTKETPSKEEPRKDDLKEKSFVDALSTCTSLECLRKAHKIPKEKTQFNFPHALIVGWQKSATTSLYKYLERSSQVVVSKQKEPEFFTAKCQADPLNGCSEKDQKYYIENTLQRDAVVAEDATLMSFEASTHYAMNGDVIAASIYAAMPWVKIVASLREPISRAASMLVHMADREKFGCLAPKNVTLYQCLTTESQLIGHPGPYNFIDSPYGNYSLALSSWITAFPERQVHVVQYEALVGDEERASYELKRLNSFLGLESDSSKKKETLTAHNVRKTKINPEGWSMKREEYVDLIHRVRPDAELVAQIIEKMGQGSAATWLQTWESIWEDNLSRCGPDGMCQIHLS